MQGVKRFQLTKKRMVLCAAVGFVGALAALNGLAYRHARAMTHFVTGPERTNPPERLSLAQKVQVLAVGVSIPKPRNRQTPADCGLPFETLRFTGARGQELEAWLVREPNARRIVLLFPGYAGSKDSLLAPAQEFYRLGWSTMLVDFHGCGGSSGDTTSLGWHEADDVTAAFHEAHRFQRGDSIILYGASMGAAAILRAVAVNRVQPVAIIVECPFDRMLTTVQNRFHAMGVPSFPSAQLLVFWGGRQLGFNGFDHNPCDYAATVTCPVLQLHGVRDPRVSVAEARRVFEALAGEKRWVQFERAGHESYLAAEPGKWKGAIESFLAL